MPPASSRGAFLGSCSLVLFAGAACSQAGAADDEEHAQGSREGSSVPMVERLAEIEAKARTIARQGGGPLWDMNGDRARAFRARLDQSKGAPARLASGLILGVELLRAGESEAALEAFLEAREERRELEDKVPPSLDRLIEEFLALAWLRIGEQENCQEGHNPASCLFPIAGDGVHLERRGSEGAVPHLEAILAHDPTDRGARWLLNLAHMTLGTHPEGVPEDWRLPPALLKPTATMEPFREIASAVGVDAFARAGGVALEDFDGDGDLDVMASSWGIDEPVRLFENRGDGSFHERTEAAGLGGLGGGLNLVHADYDNDGDADVLILRGAWRSAAGMYPNSLLRNEGGLRFREVTEEVGLLSFYPTQTAAWGDFDNDGFLDLFVGREGSRSAGMEPGQLYRNQGDGTFVDVTRETGLRAVGYIKGVVWGDYDNDGWIDLYVSCIKQPNMLFRNEPSEGGRRFREVGGEAGVRQPLHSFAAWFWDFDNDGWLDLYANGYGGSNPTNYAALFSQAAFRRGSSAGEPRNALGRVVAELLGEAPPSNPPALFKNNGDGTFTELAGPAGFHGVTLVMGANFGDLDNDGWLDAYFGTGEPSLATLVPNRMLKNDGGARFVDVTTAGGFGHVQKGHGIAFGDLDNDGDQDIYASMGGAFTGDGYANVLFENPGSANRWITLILEGVECNRSAIGARVALTVQEEAGSRTIHRVVGSGGSFGSSSLQLEVGLGESEGPVRVEVRWPGGVEESFEELEAGRVYRVKQGGQPELLERPAFELGGTGAGGGHHHHHGGASGGAGEESER